MSEQPSDAAPSDATGADEARSRAEAAQSRRFEALLEDAVRPAPIEAILAAAEARGRPRGRAWLAAAIVLLGLGVAVTVAVWSGLDRDGRGGRTAVPRDDLPQDPIPQPMPDRRVPEPVIVADPLGLGAVPDNAESLELGFLPGEVASLARFSSLRHLTLTLAIQRRPGVLVAGNDADGEDRLALLRTVPGLRTLHLRGLPLVPGDLRRLAGLTALEHLELSAITEPGSPVGSLQRFDREWARSIAEHCRARSLALGDMIAQPGCLDPIAPMRLERLTLGDLRGLRPADLEFLDRADDLRWLELRTLHAVEPVGLVQVGDVAVGARCLQPATIEALARLPRLEVLVCRQCYLGADLIQALPRGLRRLDLRSCGGVDAGLVDVLETMDDLVDVGLPLSLDGKTVFPEAPAIDGVHGRLDTATARRALLARAWSTVRLHGPIPESVAEALVAPSLGHLVLNTPDDGVDLAFVARIPSLRRFTWDHGQVWASLLEPLNEARSLEVVDLSDCMLSWRPNDFRSWEHVLDERFVLIR